MKTREMKIYEQSISYQRVKNPNVRFFTLNKNK